MSVACFVIGSASTLFTLVKSYVTKRAPRIPDRIGKSKFMHDRRETVLPQRLRGANICCDFGTHTWERSEPPLNTDLWAVAVITLNENADRIIGIVAKFARDGTDRMFELRSDDDVHRTV